MLLNMEQQEVTHRIFYYGKLVVETDNKELYLKLLQVITEHKMYEISREDMINVLVINHMEDRKVLEGSTYEQLVELIKYHHEEEIFSYDN